MHHKLTKRAFAAGLAGIVGSIAGFGGIAAADPADDAAIIVDNLPAAVEDLAANLQAAVDTAVATQSAVATAAAVTNALVEFGGDLVAGTEQFGALGLGLTLLGNGALTALQPYLAAIDDPSTAADLVNPDDVSTLLGSLPTAVDALLHGDAAVFPTDPNGLTCALGELVRGNLTAGPGFLAIGTPAVLGCSVIGAAGFVVTLTQGTNYENVGLPVLVAALVVPIAAGDYAQQLEDALAPVFDAAGPALEPVAAAISGL